MKVTDSVLTSVRGFLNVDITSDVFDNEILPLVLSALGKLSQNGVAVSKLIDINTLWSDIIDPKFIDNVDVVVLMPLYIMLSVKILFDPPPPSTVQYYQSNIDDNLWRLRLICDTTITTTEGE